MLGAGTFHNEGTMEIDITDFFVEADPMKYSASKMEIGENAGSLTWNAAMKDADAWEFLKTDEDLTEFRHWLKDFGAWSEEEATGWSKQECNALLTQFIAGDIREAHLDEIDDDDQWEDYEERAEKGSCTSSLFRSGGKVYFQMSH